MPDPTPDREKVWDHNRMSTPMANKNNYEKTSRGVRTTIGFPARSISLVFLKYVGPNYFSPIVEHVTLCL